ncbi:TIGR03086 family metal-binding protein [Kribbella sp. NPDC051620]|uniref:TIGR03086 family metal-binding protein n=1 Tax=Kribbella sp. NPDC051620 TaxID=3364120 RepID=UPI0037889AF0
MTDPRPMLARALDQTQAMIDTIGADDLALPTPCPEYDVETLLGHLMTVIARIDLALTGNNPLSIPTVTPGVTDFAGTWKERRAVADETLSNPDVLTMTCTVPWGTIPGAAAIASYTSELATHAWDLAKATGRTDLLDDAIAIYCLPLSQQFLPAEPRGGHIPFGPVVDVPADASPYDRLAGWQGRQP